MGLVEQIEQIGKDLLSQKLACVEDSGDEKQTDMLKGVYEFVYHMLALSVRTYPDAWNKLINGKFSQAEFTLVLSGIYSRLADMFSDA